MLNRTEHKEVLRVLAHQLVRCSAGHLLPGMEYLALFLDEVDHPSLGPRFQFHDP